MRVLHNRDRCIELGHVRPAGGELLVSVGVALLASGALLGPGTLTALRVATAALLGMAAYRLARAGLPRRSVSVVIDEAGVRGEPGGTAAAITEFILSGTVRTDDVRTELEYRVEAMTSEGRRQVVLARDDPASVLGDLEMLLATTPVGVRSGWGLPSSAEPWVPAPAPSPGAGGPAVDASPRPVQASRAAGATVTVIGIGLAAATVMPMLSRTDGGRAVSALSWVLGITTAIVALVAGAALLSREQRATTNGELVIDDRILGIRVRRQTVARSDVVATLAISPDGGEPRHVLVVTRGRPLAVGCESPDDARRLASALEAWR